MIICEIEIEIAGGEDGDSHSLKFTFTTSNNILNVQRREIESNKEFIADRMTAAPQYDKHKNNGQDQC